MPPRRVAALLLCATLAACTDRASDEARPTASPLPSTPSLSASPSTAAPLPSPSIAPTSASPSAIAPAGPAWPRASRGPAPAALGAVVTRRIAARSDGGTLAAGLVLPRVGGTASAPTVLTPCGRRTTLRSADVQAIAPSSAAGLPKKPTDVLVVIDPGHGGPARGTQSPDGVPEKLRNLEISREVVKSLAGRGPRVVLTRDRDMDATLPFRVALADALRADVAVSVHLNAEPDVLGGTTPGLETYASIAEPAGRRLAGVLYAHQRAYLDTLGGPWARDRDAGAKYRRRADGQDYYGLLRRAHRPFAISESLFLSEPREAALIARPEVRTGLARAIADGIVAFTTTREPGSGWVTPYPRAGDPGGAAGTCTDPAR
ncbi:MAG TPA: N-acetylmuramoyl-L-alanine amidase [Mycobacteriales bacterium]|nr:N-acetylmuramoyl-L-alanine amidase [Mycobacteriales bacterium]